MRLRNVKNAFEIIDSSDKIIKEPETKIGSWKDKYNQVHLEIGCGKGLFLEKMATKFKDDLFIGMEMMSSVICRACERFFNKDINNVFLINKNAENILEYFNKEIDRIYINFPDPWPKDRHAKRRLTSKRFLDKYRLILKDDGIIRFKTDNYDLYLYSLETMKAELKEIKYGEVIYDEDSIQTEFETKYLAVGKKIYYIEGRF